MRDERIANTPLLHFFSTQWFVYEGHDIYVTLYVVQITITSTP